MPHSALHSHLLDWYAEHARELPWRRLDAGAWAVLVSEVMLQQTPVARVLPAYLAWLERWPTPSSLACDSQSAAVRLWGRLGYPRRAQRLWQAAVVIDSEFDGVVPATVEELRSLPGVGEYTAAAVAAFAYRRRTLVLDTNVRRVLSRVTAGEQFAAPTLSKAERQSAEQLLPDSGESAAAWSVAVMELGALVCTARNPSCARCPVTSMCSWRSLGYPAYRGPPRRAQPYAGTDRQCRGRILFVLRSSSQPVDRDAATSAWHEPTQAEQALASLITDGLIVELDHRKLALA